MKLGSLQTVLGYNHAFHNLLDFNLLVTFTSQTKQIEDQCLIIMVTSGSRIFLGIKLRKCNYHNLAYFIPKIYFSEYKIYSSWEWRVSFMRNPSLPRTTCVLNLKDGGWNSLTEMWNSPPFFASLPNQNETFQIRLNVLSCLASPECRTEIYSQSWGRAGKTNTSMCLLWSLWYTNNQGEHRSRRILFLRLSNRKCPEQWSCMWVAAWICGNWEKLPV